MKAGTKKSLLIIVVVLLTAYFSFGYSQSLKISVLTCIISFVCGLLLTPLIKFNSLYCHLTIEKPKWTEKMNYKKPLIFIQFIGYLLLATGAGKILIGLFDLQKINFVGTVLLLVGIGVLTGMYLTLATIKQKK